MGKVLGPPVGRGWVALLCTFLVISGATGTYAGQAQPPPPASAPPAAETKLPPEQLDSLVAPISSSGKKDGLYWLNPDGTPGGPIGQAVARAIHEGYQAQAGSGYHGYYFRVLKGQGPAAPLGQLDYVVDGVMIGGFALIAVPLHYGVTGIKTFIVSHDGIVYEKDLGPKTNEVAKSIERYNPDKTWRRTDDEWPADLFAAN